jgi:hypothetical protein
VVATWIRICQLHPWSQYAREQLHALALQRYRVKRGLCGVAFADLPEGRPHLDLSRPLAPIGDREQGVDAIPFAAGIMLEWQHAWLRHDPSPVLRVPHSISDMNAVIGRSSVADQFIPESFTTLDK